jgi:hypothetical protein
MITKETCEAIWAAYREVETGEKLLSDMKEIRELNRIDPHSPCLKDAFGRWQHLELGIPSGSNEHRLLRVSPALAESVIRAHIENKRAELAEAQERARIELGA